MALHRATGEDQLGGDLRVRDRDGAGERRDQDDEGLISRFWKAPSPVTPSPAPPSSDREAEKG